MYIHIYIYKGIDIYREMLRAYFKHLSMLERDENEDQEGGKRKKKRKDFHR